VSESETSESGGSERSEPSLLDSSSSDAPFRWPAAIPVLGAFRAVLRSLLLREEGTAIDARFESPKKQAVLSLEGVPREGPRRVHGQDLGE